jgi:hypothetical protein
MPVYTTWCDFPPTAFCNATSRPLASSQAWLAGKSVWSLRDKEGVAGESGASDAALYGLVVAGRAAWALLSGEPPNLRTFARWTWAARMRPVPEPRIIHRCRYHSQAEKVRVAPPATEDANRWHSSSTLRQRRWLRRERQPSVMPECSKQRRSAILRGYARGRRPSLMRFCCVKPNCHPERSEGSRKPRRFFAAIRDKSSVATSATETSVPPSPSASRPGV